MSLGKNCEFRHTGSDPTSWAGETEPIAIEYRCGAHALRRKITPNRLRYRGLSGNGGREQ
jgi:hypothetical protein